MPPPPPPGAPVHLCFLGAEVTRPQWAIPPLPQDERLTKALATLFLEDGRTMFSRAFSREQLRSAILTSCGDKCDLDSFTKGVVDARGRLPYWDGSELEDALI